MIEEFVCNGIKEADLPNLEMIFSRILLYVILELIIIEIMLVFQIKLYPSYFNL